MTAGKLNERIGFSSPFTRANPAGDTQQEWKEEFERWADVYYLRGGEEVTGGGMSGRQSAIFTVRADPDTRRITTAWRVRFDDMNWNIKEKPQKTDNRLYYKFRAVSGEAQ